MIHFYKDLKNTKKRFCYYGLLFRAENLGSPQCLTNKRMHKLISTDASISHFTNRRKTNLKQTVGTVSSVVGKKKTPFFFIAQSDLPDCRFVYRFCVPNFCDNFLCPSNHAVGTFLFISLSFFNLDAILCCDVT